MLNIIAVDNLRSLTAGAEYGLGLVFFYFIAALFFFLPTVFVTAELATTFPQTGGAYVWIREAFGSQIGLFSIWLQWIYNVVWYPTMFTFIAGIFAYLIDPQLTQNTTYMISFVLISFWGITLINFYGLHISNWITVIGALIGTIFPMVFIAGLGFLWIYLGRPTQIHFNFANFIPNLTHLKNIAFFTNILFGLVGMEMSAIHAGDVKNPQRQYPRALFIGSLIILATLIFACLAITIVIPYQQLSIVSGLMDAFAVFFQAFKMDWLIPLIAFLIILGSISCASAWIIGPAKALSLASKENNLHPLLALNNRKQMPIGILLIQGAIVSFLCLTFYIMPTVNSTYWILSNLTAQLALLFYIIFFAAMIKLRYKYPAIKRPYKIPGGLIGVWIICTLGILACLFAIVIGFLPPTQVGAGKIMHYELYLLGGLLICGLIPFLLCLKKNNLVTVVEEESQ